MEYVNQDNDNDDDDEIIITAKDIILKPFTLEDEKTSKNISARSDDESYIHR